MTVLYWKMAFKLWKEGDRRGKLPNIVRTRPRPFDLYEAERVRLLGCSWATVARPEAPQVFPLGLVWAVPPQCAL